ncbi:uncharacterized protein LOC109793425 [Cajanus cajan]|uniref:uncharacterized protein LOC109793425 n=1 Tax=Cajanus cajan TaxID=3821 RepID=UPI00098D927A|nr:uncharacterized protein LOC109793425 [Cajanus cajan]XP_020208485.1 uncharacterized protein LOC109793425 [Cajanus cajan]XP_020208486.1 uncharacterized protein LOC109793425 [Cajanus cajan]XP_020208487.1 uncharacterized protein LOC109793425 [Cajanus cajan]XP_020208488.1 uncharacterized protein LOC109793425 [Cajanus cajan]XP_029126183.1 uncharacterized protein LOC109793425 [Cajanus cajan]XP_029126184.1 uncharacterized protein LOC109793425 [Cajanus cajan]
MEFQNFDPRHTGELLKHMDRQNEVLMEAYRSMLHELQKLQIEEEMLMRKMYEVTSAHGLASENDSNPPNYDYNSGAEHTKKETNEANEEHVIREGAPGAIKEPKHGEDVTVSGSVHVASDPNDAGIRKSTRERITNSRLKEFVCNN